MFLNSHRYPPGLIILVLAFLLQCATRLSAFDDCPQAQDRTIKTQPKQPTELNDQPTEQSLGIRQSNHGTTNGPNFHSRNLYDAQLAHFYTADLPVPSPQGDISAPSIDYDSWKPLDYSNPMQHDPTIYYSPPTLDTQIYRAGNSLPVQPSLKRNSLAAIPPTERPSTEVKPVSWPIKPQNPPVLIIHANQKSNNLKPIYGTPDVEYYHLKSDHTADRRVDRDGPGLTLINAPSFGPRGTSFISSKSVKGLSIIPGPKPKSKPKEQQALVMAKTPLGHHYNLQSMSRKKYGSNVHALEGIIHQGLTAGPVTDENDASRKGSDVPASFQLTPEERVTLPKQDNSVHAHSFVNKANFAKKPVTDFGGGVQPYNLSLSRFPLTISSSQERQEQVPALFSPSSGYYSTYGTDNGVSSQDNRPTEQSSHLSGSLSPNEGLVQPLDQFPLPTSLSGSNFGSLTSTLFGDSLEGSSRLNFLVKNMSAFPNRNRDAVSATGNFPKNDVGVNDLVADGPRRNGQLKSTPLPVLLEPLVATSQQPVFVIRQGHSKVKTYGTSQSSQF